MENTKDTLSSIDNDILDDINTIAPENTIDYALSIILKHWKEEAGVKTTIKFFRRNNTVTIFSDRPGFLVGRAGALYTKYKTILHEKGFISPDGIEFVEVSPFDV